MSTDRADRVAHRAAERIENGDQLHELTPEEWAATRQAYRDLVIERLSGRLGPRARTA